MELLVESYRNAFFHKANNPLLASARAGNVIGGGDWSADRLIPDLVRSTETQKPLVIRSPNASRPWQHVLDCLAGYLALGQKLLEGQAEFAAPWNFGPVQQDNISISEILRRLQLEWPEIQWALGEEPQEHEANRLYLDSTKARTILNFHPVWNLDQTLQATLDWYREFSLSGKASTASQLQHYVGAASETKARWITS